MKRFPSILAALGIAVALFGIAPSAQTVPPSLGQSSTAELDGRSQAANRCSHHDASPAVLR